MNYIMENTRVFSLLIIWFNLSDTMVQLLARRKGAKADNIRSDISFFHVTSDGKLLGCNGGLNGKLYS